MTRLGRFGTDSGERDGAVVGTATTPWAPTGSPSRWRRTRKAQAAHREDPIVTRAHSRQYKLEAR